MTEAAIDTTTRTWVVSLSEAHKDNWVICREGGLWGTPNARGGKVSAGDELFVWQSREGWRARCIIISDPYPVDASHPAPWPDDADYRWLFDISVAAEADPPIWLSSPGGYQEKTGLHTTTFQSLRTIDATSAQAVRSLFAGTPPALEAQTEVAAVEPAAGWGKSQDRERNKLIEQAGINETIRHFASLGYKLTDDRQKDGVGYDLEFSNGKETLLVEAKGIAGTQLAFNLTAKELEVSADPWFLLCAVTSALGTPALRVLTGAELRELTIQPTQYRVRGSDGLTSSPAGASPEQH